MTLFEAKRDLRIAEQGLEFAEAVNLSVMVWAQKVQDARDNLERVERCLNVSQRKQEESEMIDRAKQKQKEIFAEIEAKRQSVQRLSQG